jgi:hypothetical protein
MDQVSNSPLVPASSALIRRVDGCVGQTEIRICKGEGTRDADRFRGERRVHQYLCPREAWLTASPSCRLWKTIKMMKSSARTLPCCEQFWASSRHARLKPRCLVERWRRAKRAAVRSSETAICRWRQASQQRDALSRGVGLPFCGLSYVDDVSSMRCIVVNCRVSYPVR